MNTRKTRAKKVKLDEDSVQDYEDGSLSSFNDLEDPEAVRKSRIRDSNKEFARRMTILQTWSQYWSEYTKREGEAYPLHEAKSIMKRTKKITCPITSCRKAFTSIGGLRYHYARCNIEPNFKCLVCVPALTVTTRGELLRHMILNHCQELPSLNQEQQEIASSYFSCQNRSDRNRREKRVSAETENLSNPQKLVQCYDDLLALAHNSQSISERPYKGWHVSPKDWELLTHVIERRRFYPPEVESVNLRLPISKDRMSLKTGESAIYDTDRNDNPTTFIFYTGGINTAIAWLPKSPMDPTCHTSPELVAISVNCCSMDQSYSFKESIHNEGCIQFWEFQNHQCRKTCNPETSADKSLEQKLSLKYMIGHTYGTIFDMAWCPLGCSWQSKIDQFASDNLPRTGLLALACGDGQVRVLSVPHTDSLLLRIPIKENESVIESTPVFRAKPVASLMPPGVGPSTNYQQMSCKSICWSLDNSQKYIAAGYVNGTVALFDLSNSSPILYITVENRHVYQPIKTWFAHGGPVTSVALSPSVHEGAFIASGSLDRQLKISDPKDLNACLSTDRAPINKIVWDFRHRGVISATDTAFTSYNNKVSYKYPGAEGQHSTTISSHRSSVYGLSYSLVTGSVVTSDQAGEVFVLPQLVSRSSHKRDRNLLSVHSLYSMIPFSIKEKPMTQLVELNQETRIITLTIRNGLNHPTQQENTDNAPTIPSIEEEPEEDGLEANADFSHVERTIANMPDKFLLPIEHRPVTSYSSFKRNFGLDFIHYNSIPLGTDSKIPESCIRAADMKNIYCDRPCDYPFCSINQVAWSPNPSTFPYLLSATQVGLCRLDRVQIVDQVFRSHVEQLKLSMNKNNKTITIDNLSTKK